MKPAIDVIGAENCTGCFACYNSCPYNAIEMKEDLNGFYLPHINENCTECGVCQKFCPVINPIRLDYTLSKPKFYAGWSKDNETRIKSSSGGIFPELAKYILENEGVVFGVAWSDDLRPVHIKITDPSDIPKLMGSKYVQSYAGLSYREVLSEIRSGRKVLFSGTPCQVAGLNTFLRYSKHRANTITVGVVCHGVPSSLIFRKYIEWVEKKHNRKIASIDFRNKKKGWEDYQIVIKFKDGTEVHTHYQLDPFFRGYLQNLYLRHSCYHCQFSTIPRFEDITLGDFWGVPKELKDKRGVSVIIANTVKGKELLEELKKLNRIELIEVSKEMATQKNPRAVTGGMGIPPERTQILKDAQNLSFEDLMKKYFKVPNPLVFRIRKIAGRMIYKIFRG